jgi:hypothetical protein
MVKFNKDDRVVGKSEGIKTLVGKVQDVIQQGKNSIRYAILWDNGDEGRFTANALDKDGVVVENEPAAVAMNGNLPEVGREEVLDMLADMVEQVEEAVHVDWAEDGLI